MKLFICRCLFVYLLFFSLIGHASSDTVTVAVASNFAVIFKELILDFERMNPGCKVRLVSGASGKIFAQVKHGAPFDVFLSADQEKPLKLVEQGLAFSDTRFTYAVGELLLWSHDPGRVVNGPETLKKGTYNKLALANAKLAPYGVAAEQVLEALGFLALSRPKWVQGENIAQTFQFVESGNADMGFVAKSQVWKEGRLISGSAWSIPAKLYAPIKQDAVVLQATQNYELAKKMILFLQTSAVQNKIQSYGYQSVFTSDNSGVR